MVSLILGYDIALVLPGVADYFCFKFGVIPNNTRTHLQKPESSEVSVLPYVHTRCGAYPVSTDGVLGALRYMPKGRGFDSLWCHWNFSLK